MSLENAARSVKERQRALESEAFSKPPADYLEFQKRLGIWIGLAEALNVMAAEARREEMDE